MTSWLRRLQIDKVALVDQGANPDAHIVLFKRDEVKKAACPECGEEMGEAKKCPECGYTKEQKMAEKKPTDAERIAKLETDLKAAQDAVTKAEAASKDQPDVASIQKALADKEARLAKMEDERETDVCLRKIAGWKHLPAKADDFASTLKKLRKSVPVEAEAVCGIIEKYEKALQDSAIFSERGSAGEAGGDIYAQIRAGAAAMVQKDGKLTPEQAESLFLSTPEGRKLYAQYTAEQEDR